MSDRKLPERLLIRLVVYPLYLILKPVAAFADKRYHEGQYTDEVKRNYEQARRVYAYYLRCLEEEMNVR